MLMVTSVYRLRSRPLTEPVPVQPFPPPPPPPPVEPPVQAPLEVQGCPEPLPPLLVAGSLPSVQ